MGVDCKQEGYSHAKSVWRAENTFTSEMPLNLENGHDSKRQPVLNPMALLTAMLMVRPTVSYDPAEKDVLPQKRKLEASINEFGKRVKGIYMRNMYLFFWCCVNVLCIINNKSYI